MFSQVVFALVLVLVVFFDMALAERNKGGDILIIGMVFTLY